MKDKLVLTLSCPDKPGIVFLVSGFLFQRNCNITDSAQFLSNDTFFMRVEFTSNTYSLENLHNDFTELSEKFRMNYRFYDNRKTKTIILVSKLGHCLSDILYRYSINSLNIDIPLVISNHNDFRNLTEHYGIPFHYMENIEELGSILTDVDLIILARYMRILPANICQKYFGKIINIHHSLLPSYKGAKPFERMFENGNKITGATAHFVIPELDEGPIIEQDVMKINHHHTANDIKMITHNIESNVLCETIRLFTEHRIFIDDKKTVILN